MDPNYRTGYRSQGPWQHRVCEVPTRSQALFATCFFNTYLSVSRLYRCTIPDMIANISWLFALMVLLCSTIPSTDARLFGHVKVSSVSTITDLVSATTAPVSSPLVSSSAFVSPSFDFEQAEVAHWCSWRHGEHYKGYAMHCGVDYFQGGDLFDQRANNIDDCIAMCSNTPGCNTVSYQAEIDDGLHGKCWLKSKPGFRRYDKTILGMVKLTVPVSPDSSSVFSGVSSTSSTVAPSVRATLASMSPKSGSFTNTPTPIPISSLKASPASPTISSSPSTARSSSVTVQGKPTPTATQGGSGDHTSVSLPLWFSEANPCWHTDCSVLVTTYVGPSYPLTSIISSSKRIFFTRSVVTTKVLTSKPVTKNKVSTSLEYLQLSRTKHPGYYRPEKTSPGYARPSSGQMRHSAHHISSSSKAFPSSTRKVPARPTSYSCTILSGKITCTGKNDAVSTRTSFATIALVPGASTTTVYIPVVTCPPSTSAGSSTSRTYTEPRPVTSQTTVTGKPSGTSKFSVSSSARTYPIPVYPPTTSKEYGTTVSSQGSGYSSSVSALVSTRRSSHVTTSTARVPEVSSSLSKGGAHPSSSTSLSQMSSSLATPTKSGPVTKSVNVSWSWTSTPESSSGRSAGQQSVPSPSLGMAVVLAFSLALLFFAW
ncbi:uncharacterized protein M421DRAFT_392673 [Didymella exigua CBS 183.55]|uniref:Apple domain-containing protein n=1 Tax=Didymella exigua CBS 183.55 TaxID=1150837 RepID=A0A6A5RL76_9PLEO|nr:uncharacterized protein M421DRAFT_392673 [Didymella exigua CBS 183.55]KAF1928000.1 hypothetical protein M421DRAFT_392673 [Didymella exigua CBS 183.55]